MGYVHSPHDHPEQTDRELAAAITALIAAQERIMQIKGGIDRDHFQRVDTSQLALNLLTLHLYLVRDECIAQQISLADAEGNSSRAKYWQRQRTAMQEEGHDHGNER